MENLLSWMFQCKRPWSIKGCISAARWCETCLFPTPSGALPFACPKRTQLIPPKGFVSQLTESSILGVRSLTCHRPASFNFAGVWSHEWVTPTMPKVRWPSGIPSKTGNAKSSSMKGPRGLASESRRRRCRTANWRCGRVRGCFLFRSPEINCRVIGGWKLCSGGSLGHTTATWSVIRPSDVSYETKMITKRGWGCVCGVSSRWLFQLANTWFRECVLSRQSGGSRSGVLGEGPDAGGVRPICARQGSRKALSILHPTKIVMPEDTSDSGPVCRLGVMSQALGNNERDDAVFRKKDPCCRNRPGNRARPVFWEEQLRGYTRASRERSRPVATC